MGYRVAAGGPLADQVRRAAVDQLATAVSVLHVGGDPHEAVHEARKATKRVRAALRVVRDALGTAAYRQRNVAVRDTARRLSGARDDAVVRQALAALVATANSPTVYEGLDLGLPPPTPPDLDDVAAACDELAAVADRLRTQRLEGSWDAVEPG
ncbi:MAG: CHAD domain-containing protein, partial [Egibacteraceae bacterium]